MRPSWRKHTIRRTPRRHRRPTPQTKMKMKARHRTTGVLFIEAQGQPRSRAHCNSNSRRIDKGMQRREATQENERKQARSNNTGRVMMKMTHGTRTSAKNK
ncbi:hypothetical protein B0H19DRAFT_1142103 [Mycena capillaripes]|nr:hypothetical protein B0H19DRAFT_1142103 [Mycena capillaripes]